MKKLLILFVVLTFNLQPSTCNRIYAAVSDTTSYLRLDQSHSGQVPADGVTPCTVVVWVATETSVPLQGLQVTVYTSRGPSYDTIFYPYGQITNANGVCTATIVSSYVGGDTVTAFCEGATITENIVNNPSFELGSGPPTSWWWNNNVLWKISTDTYVSGLQSITNSCTIAGDTFTEARWVGTPYTSRWPITETTSFFASQYCKTDNLTVNTARIRIIWFRDSSVITEVNPSTLSGTNPWTLMSATVTSPATANGLMYRCQQYGAGTAWFDTVRLRRVPTLNWTASKLKFTTSAFSVTINNPSSTIIVEAQDGFGTCDASFNNTVNLSTSSPVGKFSVDKSNWQDTSIITLSSGKAMFYYKDSNTGNPVITVSRALLNADSQTETILAQGVNETASYITFTPYQIPASGVNSATTVVTINDTYGFPITNKLVTLQTTRGNSDTIQDSMGAVNSKQYTDNNGMCTWTIKSGYAGQDTLTALADGITVRNIFFDDFSKYSEGSTASPPWTVVSGTWQVQSGEYSGNAGSSHIGDLLWEDYIIEARLKTVTPGGSSWNVGRIGFRYSDSTHFYEFFMYTTGNVAIWRRYGSSWVSPTGLIATGKSPLDWHSYKIVVGGRNPINMKVYIDTETSPTINYNDSSDSRIFSGRVYFTTEGSTDAHFDDIKLYPAKVNFSATKLKITTPQRTAIIGMSSDSICIEARGNLGTDSDMNFNETVTLISSSSEGKFSLSSTSWADTVQIKLSSGYGIFYYRDVIVDSPVITVFRVGLQLDTQVVNITANPALVSDTQSYLRVSSSYIPANGSTQCTVTITVKDTAGLVLYGKTVNLNTSRGTTYDSITQPGPTDVNGQCTGYIKSSRWGGDTVTATCDGVTINENLISNPSFEDGWSSWSPVGTGTTIDTTTAKSGSKSLLCPNINSDTTYWGAAGGYVNASAGENYSVSGWAKASGYSGGVWKNLYLTFWQSVASSIGKQGPTVSSGTYDWQYIQNTVATLSGTAFIRSFPQVSQASGSGTVWFDDIRVKRVPTINWTASKLKFTTSAFTITINNPSSTIIVEAQDGFGTCDAAFNNTVNLSTSSPVGKFSIGRVTWQDTTIITLSQGSVIVYYKDSNTGNPIITAYRESLTADTQVETILAQGVNETASYITFTPYQIAASGVNSATTVVTVNDTYGFPITNKLVTLQTTRGNSDTINDSLGGSVNPQTTDANGQCTWTIKSDYAGWDTITATVDGKTITRGVNKYGAVGIWHFDTDAKDVSGYGNNAVFPTVLNSQPLWTSAPDSAAQGCALQFDGYNDYILTPNYGATNVMSFSFWFKADRIGNGGTGDYSCAIVSHADGTNGWWIEWRNNGSLELGNYVSGAYQNFSIGSFTDITNWHHLAGTITRNGAVKVRMDNEQKVSTTVGNWSDASVNFLIGSGSTGICNPDGYAQHFKGIIDEIQIYNRALSDDEIKAIYEKRTNIYWTASRIRITTPQRTAIAGMSSDSICIEARGNLGTDSDMNFNETVTLISSSSEGKFSLSSTSWADTAQIKLSSGYGIFYYRDVIVDSPVITVFRVGLQPDTQVVNITANPALVSDTQSYLRVSSSYIPANGLASCSVTITLRDDSGSPVPGKSVTIHTSRGSSFDTIIQPANTDSNGQCTGAIKSGYCGEDTITATCEGRTITQNLILNPSFEDGWSSWSPVGTGTTIDTTTAKSGSKSLLCPNINSDTTYWGAFGGYVNASAGESYSVSGWVKASGYSGGVWKNLYLTFWNSVPSFIGQQGPTVSSGTYDWQYIQNTVAALSGTAFIRISPQVSQASGSGTVWFDCIRVKRVPTVDFIDPNAVVKLTNSAFTITVNNPSPANTVEVQDAFGNRNQAFNETVVLFSSSPNGKFSLQKNSWSDTTIIYLQSGLQTFYYKDSNAGNPSITVSRSGSTASTQSETILMPSVNNTASFIIPYRPYASADGQETITVIVAINDTFGYPISGKSVTLFTNKPDSDTILANPLVTDINGRCTFALSSIAVGEDTIAASCQGQTLSYFVDDFSIYPEGGNGSPNWSTIAGTWKVTNSSFIVNEATATGEFRTYLEGVNFTNCKLEADVDIKAVYSNDTSRWVGIQVRKQEGNSNGYVLLFRKNGTVQLFEYTNTFNFATAKTVSTTATLPAKIGLKAEGNQLTCYLGGQEVYTTTNDTYSMGEVMLLASGAYATYDNVRIYPCQVSFKNYALVQGVVYNDINENQVQDTGEIGVSGVLVSDGVKVVLSGNTGTYKIYRSFEGTDTTFIFVTIPSGYKKTTEFYQQVTMSPGETKNCNFGICEFPTSADTNFSFIQITDIHIGIASTTDRDQFIEDIQQMNAFSPGPSFVVPTGDLVHGGGNISEYQNYTSALDSFAMPVYNVIGNHDYNDGTTTNYKDFLGPTYYSFDWGGRHFVVLDSVSNVSSQLSWLEKDLAFQPQGKEIIAFYHYPEQQQFVEFLSTYNTIGIFNGHWHSNKIYKYNQTLMVETPPLRFGGIDSTPRGFRLVSFNNGVMQTDFRHAGLNNYLVIVHPASGEMVGDTNTDILANVYDTRMKIAQVQFQIDGGAWNSMQKKGKYTWRAIWNPSSLTGSHSLKVKATSDTGATWENVINFTVSNTFVTPVPKPSSNWSMFHHDAQRTGLSEDEVAPPLYLKWIYSSDGSLNFSSPVVYGDRVYVGVEDEDGLDKNAVVCLDASTGEEKWKFPTDSGIKHTVAVYNNTVYALSITGVLYAIDAANGAEKWRYECGSSNPDERARSRWCYFAPVVDGGYVYAGGKEHFAKVDAASGAKVWNVAPASEWISNYSSPAVKDDRVYLGFMWSTGFHSRYTSNGGQAWTQSGDFQATCVISDTAVYSIDLGGTHHALNLSGTPLWSKSFGGSWSTSSPALSGNALYAGSPSGYVYAYNVTNGDTVWQRYTGPAILSTSPYLRGGSCVTSSPAVSGNVVYVGSQNGLLYALNATNGDTLWVWNLGVPVASSPAVSGNAVYAGAFDGNVYAFAAIAPLINVSKTHQNLRTGMSNNPLSAIFGDTVRYDIFITNNGAETAANVIITDTSVFDTSAGHPVEFVSFDTVSIDTYSYTTKLNPQESDWTAGYPPDSTSVKGLRWKFNSISAGDIRTIENVRIRIKSFSQFLPIVNYNSFVYQDKNGENTWRALSNTLDIKTKSTLLQPMFGLRLSSLGNRITLTWRTISKYSDGETCTLSKYLIYRSSISGGPYSLIGETVSLSFADTVPLSPKGYYAVLAQDNLGNTNPRSLEVCSDGEVTIRSVNLDTERDTVTSLCIPKESAGILYKETNGLGDDIRIEISSISTVDKLPGAGQTLVKAYDFIPYKGDTNNVAAGFSLRNVGFATLSIHYDLDTATNCIKQTTIPASQVKDKLGLFFWNGLEWVKLGANIDISNQALSIQTDHLSRYAIFTTTNATKLTLTKRIPPILTPNGDGINDVCFFYYENPNNRSITGRIYDLSGSLIYSQLSDGPTTNSLKWDGKDDYGNTVESGIYIYQIQGGDELISGTIVVAK